MNAQVTSLARQIEAPAVVIQDQPPTAQTTPSGSALVREQSQATKAASRLPTLPRCDVRQCHCSCHATASRTWGTWAIRHTPLSAFTRACDHSNCSARRYQFYIRVQLSRWGIPFAMVVGGEIIAGATGYTLRPSLQTQRVVEETSRGFQALLDLEESYITCDEAKSIFQEIHQSDPTFKHHVGPDGYTYLQHLVGSGPWSAYGFRCFEQIELLQFFVTKLQVGAGIETEEFVGLTLTRFWLSSRTWRVDWDSGARAI